MGLRHSSEGMDESTTFVRGLMGVLPIRETVDEGSQCMVLLYNQALG